MKNRLHHGETSIVRVASLLLTLSVLLGPSPSGMACDSPGAKAASSETGFDDLAEDIKREIHGLGYSDEVAQALVKMVRNWGLAAEKQKLDQAREDQRQGRLSKAQVAQIERDAAESLSRRIYKEFGPSWDNLDLADVVSGRKANCLGNSQLFYVLGGSLGLPVTVGIVFRPDYGDYPPGETHAVCLVDLSDGKTIMVDVTGFGSFWRRLLNFSPVSQPFVFGETFVGTGGQYETKDEGNPLGLHRSIQVMDKTDLLVLIYYGRGYAADRKGDREKALAHYGEAVRFNPKDAKGYLTRGVVQDCRGDLDRAIADYSEAIRLNPKSAEAYCVRGRVYGRRGEHDKALADFNEGIRLNPVSAEAYYGRGNMYLRKNEYDKAIADFTGAIRFQAKLAGAYWGRGNAYQGKGDLDLAIADYSDAIRLTPICADIYANRGSAYVKKGDCDKAIKDFDESIRLNPRLAEAHWGRGSVHNRKGDLDKAVANYSEAIRLNPKSAEVYCNRGSAYMQKGDWDKAIKDYDESIRLNPRLAEGYWGRGSAYEKKGEKAKAEEDFAQAKKLGHKAK